MGLGSLLSGGRSGGCEVHDGHARKANRMLLGMVAGCLGLISWHVWMYGLSSSTVSGAVSGPLPLLIAQEIRDLLFNGHGIAAEVRDVLPYFLVGIILAGYIRTFKIAVKLQASLRKYGTLSIVVASLVGIITPLCACGTITTAVSLLFAGLPLAPVMSLMVTSALLSPSTYLITLNDLGPEWTVIRTVSALAMGLFAGAVTLFLCRKGFDRGGLFVEGAVVPGDFHDEDYPIEHLRCNCRQKFGNRVAVRSGSRFLVFLAKTSEIAVTVGKYVLVGIAIGAIVERYIPNEWVFRLFGRRDPLNVVWITLASVPMFLHQISASSILSHIKSSLHGTLDGGAALAFMIGGPVTAVPTMVLFWTIFKKRVFALYMFVCLAGTVLIACAFQWLVFVPGVDTGNRLFKGVTSLAGGTSAILSKEGRLVRIALDPAERSLVATYSNDLENHGGVVFDAGFGRLAAAAAGVGDDRRYVTNIAAWLEQAGSSSERGKVLVYLASGTGSDRALAGSIAGVLRQSGHDAVPADRASLPSLTDAALAGVAQVWLLLPDPAEPGQLTDAELELITRFNRQGGGMLVALAGGNGVPEADSPAGRLLARYGVSLNGTADNGERISLGGASRLFASASELLGRILRIVHKA